MKNVLVTGAAGLIGKNLCDFLHKKGYFVVAIDDLSGSYREHIPSADIFRKINLSSDDELFSIKSIFSKYNFDTVYHLAAYAAEGLSPFIRNYNYRNNLISTVNIINNCIKYKVKRLVFTSTMAVYGGIGTPFKENQYPKPIDPYGVSKLACELDIKIAGDQHGLEWVILRPHNVYGPWQNIWDKYRNVLGIWMHQILKEEPITIYGDGEQKRAFSFLDDYLESIEILGYLDKGKNNIYNIGSDEYYSILEAANILKGVIGVPDYPVIFLDKRHEVKNAYSNHDKIKKLFPNIKETSLKDGLHIMWNWAKDQPVRKQKEWLNYELDEGIYNFWKK